MRVPVTKLMAQMCPELTAIDRLLGITVDEAAYVQYLIEAEKAVPHLTAAEKDIWAVYNAYKHPGTSAAQITKSDLPEWHWKHWIDFKPSLSLVLQILAVILILLLLCGVKLHAAPDPVDIHLISAAGDNLHLTLDPAILGQQVVISGPGYIIDPSNKALRINCVIGCSASAGFSDNSTFTVGTTAINIMGGYYTSGAAPTLTSGNAARARIDSSSYLYVDCVVGCAGGSTTPADAFANPTTAGLQFDLLAGFNGSTWDRLRETTANGLQVDVTRVQGNVAVIGTFFQATQPVSLTALPSLAAGSAVIGHTINDSGSTTAVTGNVTVVQGTGTNLHVDVDTPLPAGTAVIGHVIADSGSTTAVTGTVSVNDAQVSGTATSVSRGVVDAGTQRVIQASSTPVKESGLTTTVQTVIGSTAQLDSYYCYNPNAAVEYVQIFDISGTVTLGTSVAAWSIGVPATSGANLSGINLAFANAIKVAATTTATGLTAPGTALDCNFGYK